MCKAGFAGDDAPRAVFRECSQNSCSILRITKLIRTLSTKLSDNDLQHLTNTHCKVYIVDTSADSTIASIVGRPRYHK